MAKTFLNIVVIEDSLPDFELMKSAISAHFDCHMQLVTAKADFERALARTCPSLIISDSNIVHFDGFEAFQIARQQCPQVPFVFCSGSISQTRQRRALEAGAHWVTKDLNFEPLVDVLKKIYP